MFKTMRSLLFITMIIPLTCSQYSDANLARQKSEILRTPQLTRPHENISSADCIQIYYDKTSDSNYRLGRLYAMNLANILGHFPKYQTILSPIEKYQKGELNNCSTNFYIGSYFENAIPADFFIDVETTSNRVVWIGYSFWKLNEKLPQIFGVDYLGLDHGDPTHLDSHGNQSFYKNVLYKGETFSKYASTDSNRKFIGQPEISKLEVQDTSNTKVLAYIQHSYSRKKIPWAVQKKNHYIFSEIPFTFMHEADRYLVFSDLLFDILKEKPIRNNKIAIVRLEDIHPKISLLYLKQALDIAQSFEIKPLLSLIPIFRDPLNPVAAVSVSMSQTKDFSDTIKGYEASGGELIWHGVTHQYNNQKNPLSGVTGEDYEFWDELHQTPILNDSYKTVYEKLDAGRNEFYRNHLDPIAWMTPHYKSSALDCVIFGKLFSWVVGRQVYFDFKKTEDNQNNIQVSQSNEIFTGQFYPYEIYGDMYGQNVIPENLGNVQLSGGGIGLSARSAKDILRDARRNLILRDVWASTFYHPFLLMGQADQESDFQLILSGLKDMGYEFISLKQFINSSKNIHRFQIIDKED